MRKTIPEIRERLKLMDEKELRKTLCVLFQSMGLSEVVESHGTQEFGKDIVFYDSDKLNNITWYACVVKVNDINQSGFETVVRQINECFRKSYPSTSQGNVSIDQVYVITNGSYKDNAKVQIAEQIDKKTKNIIFWTDGDIAKAIEKSDYILGILFGNQDLIQSIYNEHIIKVLSLDNSIKLFESDFDVNLHSVENFRIKIKAKAKSLENETGEYLKTVDPNFHRIPVKPLPDIEDILTNKKFILLHGIATSGKSTTLKTLGKDFIAKENKGFVFYYELNKIANFLNENDIASLLRDEFKKVTNTELSLEPFDVEKDYLLLLLDGLDEIPTESARNSILEKIIALRSIKNVRIVLTSRTSDYLKNNPQIENNFESYELLPLTVNDILNLGSKILGEDSKLSGFVKLVKHSELIKSFPKTPLTAILLAILFKEDRLDVKELPKNITELYKKFTDVFLNRWDKNKGISEQYLVKEKEFVLQKIAEHLHKKGYTSISEIELTSFLEALFDKIPMTSFNKPEQFLESIKQRTSLLIKEEFDSTYKFFHLTIQEYLSITLFDHNDEDLLVENFYDNWWINPNIFYAGTKSHSSNVLDRIAKLEIYPSDIGSKASYIIHSSKVLQAAHLLENNKRRNVLKSMITIFDSLLRDLINDIIVDDDIKIRKRTVLEIILWARSFFFEFFGSTQFKSELDILVKDMLEESNSLTDITVYCVSYTLAVISKDSDYLYNFLIKPKNINPRWYRIIDVDIKIKNLTVTNKKVQSKFQSKAFRNRHYIHQQFFDKLEKHYNSITCIND
ncbi:hypothetical protein GCM10027592_56660 [Spirosoma flavus]